MIDAMILKGFVSPEDFSEGTTTEKLQKAFKTSNEKDICRVVLSGNYEVEETILIYPETDVVFENATVTAKGDFPVFTNAGFKEKDHACSFVEEEINIRAEGSTVNGDIFFYNAARVSVEGLNINGSLTFEFCNQIRLENDVITGKTGLSFLRGTNTVIASGLTVKGEKYAVSIDSTIKENDYCIGFDGDVHDMVIRDSELSASVAAADIEVDDESLAYNIFVDGIKTDKAVLVVSEKSGELEPGRYRDLSVTNCTTSAKETVVLNSKTLNCCFK